jgi:hypothetical protein
MPSGAADVMFAVSKCGKRGSFRQVAITSRFDVYYTFRQPDGKTIASEQVRVRSKHVGEFLLRVQKLGVLFWEKRYGKGEPTDPGGWMLVMEMDGHMHKWQGCGEYPPQWDELWDMVDELLEL